MGQPNACNTKKKNEKFNEKGQKTCARMCAMCAKWQEVTSAKPKMVASNFCRET